MKSNDRSKIIVMVILTVVILIVFGIIIYKLISENKHENKHENTTFHPEEYKGGLVNSCNSKNNSNPECQINVDTDPVDNIKNVVKQTILLEEHIIEKNNVCHECIITHFLHCLGLLEEAIKIANKNVRKYPRLEEAFELYKELFEEWSKNKQNPESLQNISEKLRDMRKKLMEQYYIL